MKTNVRYGVVNVRDRVNYEKKYHKPFNYEYLGKNKLKAIKICRKKQNSNYIVEEIYDTKTVKNFKEEIFRSGSYKEYQKC